MSSEHDQKAKRDRTDDLVKGKQNKSEQKYLLSGRESKDISMSRMALFSASGVSYWTAITRRTTWASSNPSGAGQKLRRGKTFGNLHSCLSKLPLRFNNNCEFSLASLSLLSNIIQNRYISFSFDGQ